MTHRFPIKEIARQAGLGTATVDRVLNNRAHVSDQTRARVTAALAELQAQEAQLSARGRRLFIDIVVEAPQRFTKQIRSACEAVLPQVSQAVYRPRFLFQELMQPREMTATLTRIRKRGSHGVILKARNTPAVHQMVDALTQARIPVITLVTDLPDSARLAYVGLDNTQAGRTAAYLLAQMLGPTRPGTAPDPILTTRSQQEFQGEAARFSAFAHHMSRACPGREIVQITGGAGLDRATRAALDQQLITLPRIGAVYSIGGGNRAMLRALQEADRLPQCFIAHDLDAENRALLQQHDITLVLHHDLTQDLLRAFQALSAWHGLSPPIDDSPRTSDVQIITPHNLPSAR